MYKLCRHIKTNGQRCKSPALSGSAYCYFHARVHTMAKAKSTVCDDVDLPVLEDSASIQVAISQIMAGLLSSRLDARHTGLLLYALQIASQNIDRKTFHSDSEIVRSMTVTEEGDELAPEKEKCESSDCASCHRRDTCDDYYPDEEDCDSDEDEEECDSEEDDNDSGEDDCAADEGDEELAVPSPARPGIQRLQRAILARLPELKALRPPGEDPDCGIRQSAEKCSALKGHDSGRDVLTGHDFRGCGKTLDSCPIAFPVRIFAASGLFRCCNFASFCPWKPFFGLQAHFGLNRPALQSASTFAYASGCMPPWSADKTNPLV